MVKKKILELATIFLLALVIFSIFSINSEAANDKISSGVKSRMLDGEKVPVIIILKIQEYLSGAPDGNNVLSLKKHASQSQKSLVSFLEEEKIKGNASKINQFWIVNAIALNASPYLIEEIAQSDEVELIELDSQFHINEDYSVQVSSGQIANATSQVKRINATEIWGYGIDGSGINVSIIDTGIDPLHPDIAGRVVKWKDFVGNQGSPYDDDGHGTHVAGTAGGNGAGGITTGVAPNVSLFGVKVLDAYGSGSESNVINGIQWSIENKANIISMSLGSDQIWTSPNCDSNEPFMSVAINNAIGAGAVVVVASGNNRFGVSSPGCIGNAIAVGAVDSNDVIAYFSGRGGAMADHGVVAPGVGTTSLNYHTTGYIQLSGTSMATPHAAGAFALILEAAQKKGIVLTPAQAKNILMNSSKDLGIAGKDNTYGAGRIDAFEAVKGFVLPGRGYINGTVLDNITKQGIAGAIVTTNNSITTTTNETGCYSLDLIEGAYELTAEFDPTYYANYTITVFAIEGVVVLKDIELVEKPKGTITGSVTQI